MDFESLEQSSQRSSKKLEQAKEEPQELKTLASGEQKAESIGEASPLKNGTAPNKGSPYSGQTKNPSMTEAASSIEGGTKIVHKVKKRKLSVKENVVINLQNFNPFKPMRMINSPRSLEVCFSQGVNPTTLFHKSYEAIKGSIKLAITHRIRTSFEQKQQRIPPSEIH